MQLRIAVCNHKGGSGKTSTAMLVAANLASPTYKVAVVDLDTQASAQLWSQAAEAPMKFPAHVVAATAATLLTVLTSLKDVDAILLDCPPSSTAPATLEALRVATLVLIPCLPSALDYWATDAMQLVADRYPAPRLVVVNQTTNTNLCTEMIDHIEKSWPTAHARLGARSAYKEAAAQGLGVRQLPGRANHAAIAEMDALSLEILAAATKAA